MELNVLNSVFSGRGRKCDCIVVSFSVVLVSFSVVLPTM